MPIVARAVNVCADCGHPQVEVQILGARASKGEH